MDKEAVGMECSHKTNCIARYDHMQCLDCGAVQTDGGWGVASRMWFKDLAAAKFYKQHGRLPEPAAIAQQPAAQAVGLTDEQFIAAHGERLAAMLGIKEWWDIADRDARIKAALLSRAAPSGEAVAYVECRECCRCGHTGINDAHAQDACCSNCDWTGPSPKEDVCPGCAQTGTMRAACPKCSSVYRLLCDANIAAPQPSEQQAEQPAEDDTPAICDPRYFEDDEQTAEEARGVALVAALEMARDAMKGNGLTERELPRVFEIIEAALLAAPAAAKNGCPCAPEGDGTGNKCPGPDGRLLCDPAPAAAEVQPESPMKAVADALKRKAEAESFENWKARQAQGGALSDDEILRIAWQDCKTYPWGIGSRRADFLRAVRAILARAASEPRAEGREAVAVVESWTNGSYSRNYRLRWLREVEAGTTLYTALAAQKKGA